MDVNMRLTGVQEIDAVIRGLPAQLNHKVLQATHAKSAKVLVDTAKLLAPEGPTGNTIDSIGVVKPAFSKAFEMGLIETGPRRGRYKGHAAHLIEHGTGPRENKKGANRGVMPKHPFMLPAWERTKAMVMGSIRENLGRTVWAFMRRKLKSG